MVNSKTNTTKKASKNYATSSVRTNSDIIDSIYNTKKAKTRTTPTSLDDMVATLSQIPDTTSRSSAKKSISTLKKAINKSQILKFDN